jgi:endonuclease I
LATVLTHGMTDAARRRNDVVFRLQNNRNPFVNHPE